jgi:glycosyltransferase involved in cell wall biosynthesis
VIIVHLAPASLPVTHRRGGAIQRRVLEIAKAQSARGHKVILYSAVDSLRCSGGGVGGRSGENDYAQERDDDIEIRNVSCQQTAYFREIEYLVKVRRDLKGQKVDVLHFHSLPEGAALSGGIAGKKILSYDYFIFRRGKQTPLYWWYRNALRKFSCLLPVSEYCRRGSQAYWDFKDVPVQVLHNGVSLQQFCPNPEQGLSKKRELGIDSEKVILYVGRVCEQKGTDVLIDAYLRLKEKDSASRIVVAGPADMFGKRGENELTRRISECGGLYLGAVEEDQLNAVYNMADVFVMPTREIEMFGMAALEAQACGKPVVASRHGGLPEVISEKSGLFFQTGDSAGLASQLSLILGNERLCQSLGLAARENASRFAWPRIVGQLEDIYSES